MSQKYSKVMIDDLRKNWRVNLDGTAIDALNPDGEGNVGDVVIIEDARTTIPAGNGARYPMHE